MSLPPSPVIAHQIWVDLPAHAGLEMGLTYGHHQALSPGQLVQVPLGSRQTLGVVSQVLTDSAATSAWGELKGMTEVLHHCPPLGQAWLDLVRFAARYYQRSLGEVAAMALPSGLKKTSDAQLAKRMAAIQKRIAQAAPATSAPAPMPPELSEEQAQALQALSSHSGASLLFGATGSGKTEVYLRLMASILSRDSNSQILVMVPEINLTPQLEERLRARFHNLGPHAVVSLHSGLTPAQRLNHWLMAHLGIARVVLGTRLSVFTPMPHLKLLVVDEEHDPSFKQSDGPRHSARDLAVMRGHLQNLPVVLGSATPSLESWHNSARPANEPGAYQRVLMPQRQGNAPMPTLRLVDMNRHPRNTLLSKPLEMAMQARIAQGEQVLLLLNRRGYAPVLFCSQCQWTSDCPHCSAHQVVHKSDGRLHCHHCGAQARWPANCPNCNHPDLLPLGQGTEQLEEALIERLSGWSRPDGQTVRIMRIDADVTRHRGALNERLEAFHDGHADVLIGTQMIAKGHDFQRVGLVAALNPDGALFSSDFRAPERLFALLLQTAGRAGRNPLQSSASEMWIQTHHPEHGLYQALRQFDYAQFANDELQARAQVGLPPFSHQALLRAEARQAEQALGLLTAQHQACLELVQAHDLPITVNLPVPMSLSKLANVHRAQLLIESPSRPALQKFLRLWQVENAPQLKRQHRVLRWAWDVDPAHI